MFNDFAVARKFVEVSVAVKRGFPLVTNHVSHVNKVLNVVKGACCCRFKLRQPQGGRGIAIAFFTDIRYHFGGRAARVTATIATSHGNRPFNSLIHVGDF